MITEYEWRRQAQRRRRRRTTLWGAQCMVSAKPCCTLMHDRSFQLFLLLVALSFALVLPQLFPYPSQESFAELPVTGGETAASPRRVREITYAFPAELEIEQKIYSVDELLRGRMLLLDEHHPLPADVPAPNTTSIAAYGKGRVPVDNFQIKSGRQTIDALAELFLDLNTQGVSGLIVADGTVSRAQQRQRQEDNVRERMRTSSIEAAVEQTLNTLDMPGFGEMLQEYTVAIRPQSQQKQSQWQTLLRTAWKHGFVRSVPEQSERQASRFRWVGKAHATAMTYLDLSMEEYLRWMHEKGVLAIREQGQLQYLILCRPMKGEYLAVDLPVQAKYEASLDNLGYALIACTFP